MRVIKVQGQLSVSKILVGEHFQNIKKYINPQKTTVISDRNIYRYYAGDFPPSKLVLLRSGESSKTLDTVQRIYRELLNHGADRSSFILGIGGGVVCDITGFAASTYMRGVNFGFVSTSLLSQVDASAGGKNGINFDGYKNIVGVFNQPEFVICDPHMLKTLPEKEVFNGFAEVIKHGTIGDPELLEILEEQSDRALALDPKLMTRIIHDSIRVKADIVQQDEREVGRRKSLNFGHTLAHAIEKIYNLSHGEAVSIGMVFALRLSLKKGILKSESVLDRLIQLLRCFHLPISLEKNPLPVFEAMAKDKKKSGEVIDFVLLKDIGLPYLQKIPISLLEEESLDLRQSK